MRRAVADTSALIAVAQGRIPELPDDLEVAVSAVTLGELHAGVFAAVQRGDIAATADRLHTLAMAATLGPIPIDERVAETWGRLRIELRAAGRTLTTNDSWIAATAIAEGVPVATQDADFDDLPGLTVVRL